MLVRRLYRLKSRLWLLLLVLSIIYLALRHKHPSFKMIRADHDVTGQSEYPLAVSPAIVGSYPAETKSGAGYFYDDVLEYRVWLHTDRGANPLNGDQDYFEAFAKYENAKKFSETAKGAEEPVVLVRQREWIGEPEPGHFIPEKQERITEWRVKWLAGDHRTADSIQEFMKHPKPAQREDDDTY
jgi:putative acetyltransferase